MASLFGWNVEEMKIAGLEISDYYKEIVIMLKWFLSEILLYIVSDIYIAVVNSIIVPLMEYKT